MQVLDGREDLLHYLGSILLREAAFFYYVLEKLPAPAEFSHQMITVIIDVHLVELNYIGVINILHDLKLVLELSGN